MKSYEEMLAIAIYGNDGRESLLKLKTLLQERQSDNKIEVMNKYYNSYVELLNEFGEDEKMSNLRTTSTKTTRDKGRNKKNRSGIINASESNGLIGLSRGSKPKILHRSAQKHFRKILIAMKRGAEYDSSSPIAVDALEDKKSTKNDN